MTKRIITILWLIAANTFLTFSQERANDFFVGGSFGIDFSDSKATGLEAKITSLSTAFIGGYHITDNIAVGVDLEYNITNTNFDEDQLVDYSNNSEFLIAPFFRYYFVSDLFVQAQGNIGNMNSEVKTYYIDPVSMETINDLAKYTYFAYGYGIGFGYTMKLKENIYLEPMVRYLGNKYIDKEDDDDFNQTSFYFNIGLMVTL
jgi:hypothetical protein